MASSFAVSQGHPLLAQIGKLDGAGLPLTGPSDVVVLQGSCIEDTTRTLDVETEARQRDDCPAIPGTQTAPGGFVSTTFDLGTMLTAGRARDLAGIRLPESS